MEWNWFMKTKWLLAALAVLLVAGESQAQGRRGMFRRNAEPAYGNYQPFTTNQVVTTNQPTLVAQGQTQTTTTTTTDPRRSFYPPAEAERAAVIDLRLNNPTAQVFFDERPTTQLGTSRQYVTPPLEADKEYTYQVRIRWTNNGQQQEETRQVQVRAGGRVQLDLTQPAGQPEAAPAPRPATEVPQP